MDREDIIRMAAEVWNAGSFFPIPSSDDIERFAELVAAAEREACALEVERYRTAITDCLDFAGGRAPMWGERAIKAFGILEAAVAAGRGEA